MKLKLRILTPLLAALLFVSTLATPAAAQNRIPVNVANATDDVDVAFLIRYIGSDALAKVAVTTGDIVLSDGAGGDVADTAVTECGATDGTLAVATCTTLATLIDGCNASANWRCVLVDGVRSDSVTSAALLTRSATAANTAAGVTIFWDTSVKFHTTRALLPPGFRTIDRYLSGPGNATITYPFQGRQTFLQYFNGTSTYATGTSTIQFIEDDTATGTSTVVFSVPGGATTANKVLTDFIYVPFQFNLGMRALVRISNSAAASVVTVVAAGYTY